MKNILTSAVMLLLLLTFSKSNAQLKVFPANRVAKGPTFGSTLPGNEAVYLNGGIDITCVPATSGISIVAMGNAPIIEPQWNHTASTL